MTVNPRRSDPSSRWQALFPALLFLACLIVQPACGAGADPPIGLTEQAAILSPLPGPTPVLSSPPVACPDAATTPSPFPASPLPISATAPAGTLPGAFAVTPTGEATYSISLTAPPGRAGMEPHISITYNSAAGDGPLGVGFSLAGLSAVTRCPSNLARDNRIREVRYDADDNYCLDGRRLVPVAASGGDVEYRTFPDSFARIIGHFAASTAQGPQSFTVQAATSLRLEYGTTSNSKAWAKGGVVRAWHVAKAADRRGNFIAYSYLNDADPSDGHTVEHLPLEIRYTGFDGSPSAAPTRAVRFHYSDLAPSFARTLYTRGMALKRSRTLSGIDMVGPGGAVVRAYQLGYGLTPSTRRVRLERVTECAADGVCKPSTRFSYTEGLSGLTKIDTGIKAPFSPKASPMTLDLDGDGRDDLLVPDLADSADDSTQAIIGANGAVRTYWNVAKNHGGVLSSLFGAPASVRFSDAVPAALPVHEDGSLNIDKLQPEPGTAIDYNQDGLADILVHDHYGDWEHVSLLLAKKGGGFDRHQTAIPRPVPTGTPMANLRARDGSLHLADVDGDGVPDLIACKNATPNTAGSDDFQWRLHRWTPVGPGWEAGGDAIDALYRYPCDTELHTLDPNGDGKIDLVVRGASVVSNHLILNTTYVALTRNEGGAWSSTDIGLPAAGYGRVVFLDVNGDGLVDAIQANQDRQLRTYINTGDGFAAPVLSLPPLVADQDAFLSLATTLDYDGDGLRDILVPMPGGVAPGGSLTLPSWAILRSTGKTTGPTFAIVNPHIPFEAHLGEGGITPADPHGPRVADVDGDGAEDVIVKLGTSYKLFHNKGADQDLLRTVTDGMNARDPGTTGAVANVIVAYDHLTDDAVTDGVPEGSPERQDYTYVSRFAPGKDCAYPLHCIVGPRRVVSGYKANNGADKLRSFAVKYRDGRYHRRGYGFLGFGSRVTEDLQTGAATEEVFDNRAILGAGRVIHENRWSPPLAGQPDQARMELSYVDVEWTTVKTYGGKTYFALPMKRRIRQKQALFAAGPGAATSEDIAHAAASLSDGGAVTTIADSSTLVANYDTFGHILAEATTAAGVDLSVVTTRTYKNDENAWLIGLLSTEDACSTAAGTKQCRYLKRYHDGYGQTTYEALSTLDGSAETKLSTSFEYDRFGNLVHTMVKDAFGNARAACTSYEPEGIFPFASKNAAGHVTYARFDPGLGVLTDAVDPNRLITRLAYDGFGRVAKELRPDGTSTTYDLQRTQAAPWRVSLHTIATGGGDETVEVDSLGRPVRRLWHGPEPVCTTLACAGSQPPRVMQRIIYDDLGERVAKRSVPASEITPEGQLAYERWQYDALGRVAVYTAPWGAQTKLAYVGSVVQIVEPGKPPATTSRDALGRVTGVLDAGGGFTSYTYGPFGHMRTATAPDGTVTTMVRDMWGRTKEHTDPNRGKSFSHYNGFGDLTSRADALGRTVELSYDFIGRKVARIDRHGAEIAETRWTWDTAPLGIKKKALGALAAVESADATKTYAYDHLGRLTTSTLSIDGEELSSTLTYDPATGHVSQIAYPEPAGAEPFAVVRGYDTYGHMVRVRVAGAHTDLWRMTGADGAGRIQEEQLGNGAATSWTYDEGSGAVQRILTMRGLTKVQDLTYLYDSRRNLTSRRDALQPVHRTEQFRYDALDRLKCAYFGDVASKAAPCATSYAYNATGNLTSKSDVGTLVYADPAHPHAVTDAGTSHYAYDAVGNQVTRTGVKLTYTPFDLPRTIDAIKAKKTTWFGYDGDEQRVKKAVTGPSGTTATTYFGDLYEREKPPDGVEEHRYHIHAAGRVVATMTRAGDTSSTQYLHPDNLGSTETLTDASGAVSEKRSYDAFGARRNPTWGDTSPPPTPKTSRGYTGHEDEADLGLVNMKGRIYDPKLGRFLMPDPLVSRPYDGQGWNRYSYVRNNPLSYVDPSGFDWTRTASGEVIFGDDPLIGKRPPPQGAAPPAGPPPPPGWTPPEPDVSQSLAAGAAHAPNDTGTLGSGSSDSAPAQQSFVEDAWTAAGAFGKALVGPLVKGYLHQFDTRLGTLHALVPVLGLAHGAAEAAVATGAALSRGDREGAAVEAGTRLPVSSGILSLVRAADEGLDDWEAGNRAPAVIGRTWGKLTAGAVGVVLGVVAVAGGVSAAGGLADLASVRTSLGMQQGQGTLARLDVGGRTFYGINGHGQPVAPLKVNAWSATHAEADAFAQAARGGVRGGVGRLFVDRPLCKACGTFGGVRSMARQIGLDSLEVTTPSGTYIITP